MKSLKKHHGASAEENRSSCRLRIHPATAAVLQLRLKRAWAACQEGVDSASLSRLCGDSRRIEACLREIQAEKGMRLPGKGTPRILLFARGLIVGGERRVGQEELLEAIAAFEHTHPLRMRELEAMPAALRIAVCEAVSTAAGEVLDTVQAQRRACRWAEQGGRLPKRCDAAFLAHARRCCIEGEQAARLRRLTEGRRLDAAVERFQRWEDDCCLRLDNLTGLVRLLERLDWRECFESLSAVERELRKDATYARMDGPSRAQARSAAAELAQAFHLEEAAVVRCAMDLARRQETTVCFYLLDDAGRQVLRSACGASRRLRRRIPDPGGEKSMALLLGASAVLLILSCSMIGTPLLWIFAVPLAWFFGVQLVGRFYSRWVKPHPLPKLRLAQIPEEARTIVVLPVLLSSVERTRQMLAQMEALGCLEKDANIDFLLLGDFRDADAQHQPEDEAILSTAREGVAALNGAAERKKYFYLHRQRSWRSRDEKWMGENRKRGALTALNRLLLGRENAAEAFGAEQTAAEELIGRYRYVVTLDSDTQYLPGTIHKLVGAMLHPLNRRYGLLQPCMHSTIESDVNAYTALTAGSGGVDGYSVSVSDFWQDMTGFGNFAGKGIYDVRAFAAATDGVLPDAEILSHDLIEGILSGAGFLSDVCFYDGVPDSLAADLGRLHRWTRGDWQLLKVIFSRLPISLPNRMKMIGNLLRSLYAPALVSLLVNGVWLDAPGAFLLGLLAVFFDALLAPADARLWKHAVLRLATLPAHAGQMLDAILRALWRLFVSRKHLMDWVPAADAAGTRMNLRLPGRVTALLLLPGLLLPHWAPAVVGLALLFWVGADWADDLSGKRSDAAGALSPAQAALLRTLARETWHFFETFVPEEGPGLPPDNVQFDPPAGVAMRTSPTNIGLYLMSCISARELGLIGGEEMHARMEKTVATLERLEKWEGQLYNWYDTEALVPLRPRYVSAVDSGNLAAALLLCAQGTEGGLAARMNALAEGMRLDALYDRERHLFFIGADAESGSVSQAHYDLYASEARILSYAAMMLGQVPVKHWKRLGRPAAGKGQALLSWSGTMFEYLMPELVLHSHAASLAGRSRMDAVAAQQRFGQRHGRPWGVSESGHYAFDLKLNYQYHAFGLGELALSGEAVDGVIAPYASALALCCNPKAAADNLQRMRQMGWSGPYGMLEAADYRSGEVKLVRSCMAHHQGMILCAIANALGQDVLPRLLMGDPRARALKLLLQERPGGKLRLPVRRERRLPQQVRREPSLRRSADPERICETQLLSGGGTAALVTANGGAFIRRGGLLLNRSTGNLRSRAEGAYVHLADVDSGEKVVLGASGRAEFDAGSACFREKLGTVKACLTLAVSPEDGAFFQRLVLENRGSAPCTLEATGCMAVALAQQKDARAHAVFQNLFVESRREGDALLFRRRCRERGRRLPELMYLCSEETQWETDMDLLTGRTGALGMPGGIAGEFAGSLGAVLNPCAALRCRVRIGGGGTVRLHFALTATENCGERIARLREPAAAERAIQLAEVHARAVLKHTGMERALYRPANRAAALLADAGLRPALHRFDEREALSREALWQTGISGELPILLMEMEDEQQLKPLRELVGLHAFYAAMGVETDLVLIDGGEGVYRKPVRDALERVLCASHLHDRRALPGGVFLLEKGQMGVEAVCRAAALRFVSGQGLADQLRGILNGLRPQTGRAWAKMQPVKREIPAELAFFNGYGGFCGGDYLICLRSGSLPPAPWSNILATEQAGAVMTERGGGFAWRENSRSGRLTPYGNDALREGWGWMFYLLDEKNRSWARLLPGDAPMTDFSVRFSPNRCRWEAACGEARFAVEATAEGQGIVFSAEIENTGKAAVQWKLAAAADWLLGADAADRCMLRTWHSGGACFAAGASGVGCLASDAPLCRPGCDLNTFCGRGDLCSPEGFDLLDSRKSGWTLLVPLRLDAGERKRMRFVLFGAATIGEAMECLRAFRSGKAAGQKERLLRIETPDEALNLLANGFLPAQVKYGRILARTGLYQPGGAYGFRDQLQDMLPLIHTEPERVRAHLLRCAAKQFEDGDVLHWWHEPATGVRTRISDDLLFLPYVTAQYVAVTGDTGILREEVPFLEAIEIPEGSEDVYAPMRPSAIRASLHTHCMRAFNRAARTGEHGLCLMGGGDWNDGMNRVGSGGRGESIWLTEFLAACAADYARIAPEADDAAWLNDLSRRMRAAVETAGWDGSWYLRAYTDGGERLGGQDCHACRIDLISQAWAVLAGLDRVRCASAMDAAWTQLADEKRKIIRLLAPPFDQNGNFDPGYIAAYPPGIRENGAQYTHAACWLLLALVRMGDAQRAHAAIEMLLPVNHSLNSRDAETYRVEPYVMAADVYADALHPGRGGWTWYTGSAAWMLMAIYALLGYERRGNRVRLHALLGEWEQVSLTLQCGSSSYTLVCSREAKAVTLDGAVTGDWVELADDGKQHRAVFPPRVAGAAEQFSCKK